MNSQVEQWIEEVFPTNGPAEKKVAKPLPGQPKLSPEEEAAQRKEMMQYTFVIVSTMVVMTAIMVFGAYMAGARFDLVWRDVKKHGFSLGGASASKATHNVGAAHSEL